MRQQPSCNQTVHMLLAQLFNTMLLLVKRANLNSKVLHVVPKKPIYQSPSTLNWWGPTLVEQINFHAHLLSGFCPNC